MNSLNECLRAYAPVVGRLLMALIFLMSAYGKITAFGPTAASMAGKGMPISETLLVAAIAIEVIAGVLLVIGWKTRLAALALIVFLVPATLYFHDYWNYPQEQVRNQRNHFMKNVAILGALVFVIGMGAGPLSFDSRLDNRRRRSSNA